MTSTPANGLTGWKAVIQAVAKIKKICTTEEISRPRTNAAIVAISAIPQFHNILGIRAEMVFGGTQPETAIESARFQKTDANAMPPTAIELKVYLGSSLTHVGKASSSLPAIR